MDCYIRFKELESEFVSVCWLLSHRKKRLVRNNSVMKEIFEYVDIIIDNTNYVSGLIRGFVNKDVNDNSERVLRAANSMIESSINTIRDVWARAASYRFFYNSGKNMMASEDSLLQMRNEIKAKIAPIICTTTNIYSAIQKN